jgi:hypothetical protein
MYWLPAENNAGVRKCRFLAIDTGTRWLRGDRGSGMTSDGTARGLLDMRVLFNHCPLQGRLPRAFGKALGVVQHQDSKPTSLLLSTDLLLRASCMDLRVHAGIHSLQSTRVWRA